MGKKTGARETLAETFAGFGVEEEVEEEIGGFFLPTPSYVEKQKELENEQRFTLDYAFRLAGGRESAIALARLASANDERIRGVVEGWEQLSVAQQGEKGTLLEDLCIENELDPSEFLGICTAVAHRFSLNSASIVAALSLEDVVKAGTEKAKRGDGTADRRLIYEHAAFIQPRQPGVAVQINNAPAAQGTMLPEFKSLSEIALNAIARAALPAAPKEIAEVEGVVIDAEPISADS